jgi:hypothetical protein
LTKTNARVRLRGAPSTLERNKCAHQDASIVSNLHFQNTASTFLEIIIKVLAVIRGHCKLAATPPFLLRYTSAAASTSATAGSSRVAKKAELELELQLYVMLETPLCVCLILFIFVCAERINDRLEFILV